MAEPLHIGTRLGAAFALLILLPLALCLFAYQEVSAMSAQARALQQKALARRAALIRINEALDDAQQHFKHYILRGLDYDRKFAGAIDALERAAEDYKNSGALSDGETMQLAALQAGSASFRAGMATLVALRGHSDDPVRLDRAAMGAGQTATVALEELRKSCELVSVRADAKMNEVGARAPQLIIGNLIAMATLSAGCAMLILGCVLWRIKQALRVKRIVTAVNLNQAKDEVERLRRTLEYMHDCLGGPQPQPQTGPARQGAPHGGTREH